MKFHGKIGQIKKTASVESLMCNFYGQEMRYKDDGQVFHYLRKAN